MKLQTLDAYKKAILIHYQNTNDGDLYHYLSNPTPKSLKNACEDLYHYELPNSDRLILQAFFRFKPTEDPITAIKKFDIDKFRPIQNFLKEKTSDTNKINLNLIALLINFTPRSHVNFLQSKPIDLDNDFLDIGNLDNNSSELESSYLISETQQPVNLIALFFIFILMIGTIYQMSLDSNPILTSNSANLNFHKNNLESLKILNKYPINTKEHPFNSVPFNNFYSQGKSFIIQDK